MPRIGRRRAAWRVRILPCGSSSDLLQSMHTISAGPEHFHRNGRPWIASADVGASHIVSAFVMLSGSNSKLTPKCNGNRDSWRVSQGCHHYSSGAPYAAADITGNAMTAFNVVRFRVKPGREPEFLEAHRNVQADWPGLKKVNMISPVSVPTA